MTARGANEGRVKAVSRQPGMTAGSGVRGHTKQPGMTAGGGGGGGGGGARPKETHQAELKITAGHWPFPCIFPKVVGCYGQPYTCTDDYATIPLNALLTSQHHFMSSVVFNIQLPRPTKTFFKLCQVGGREPKMGGR